ncbi:unnamed protein product [Protopolystoma xenopodis]|uniref:Uncharacterized protein n=1 Tax=Protopolystoma xenopodis TaxID=117903 RepID=A0A3S5AFR2_9PLAT|nr:unnamed protein product [Protopolystoma xenopodis]
MDERNLFEAYFFPADAPASVSLNNEVVFDSSPVRPSRDWRTDLWWKWGGLATDVSPVPVSAPLARVDDTTGDDP